MTMQPPAGLLGALMSGGPLPIPKIPCGVCIGMGRLEPAHAVTLLSGSLVCADHAQDQYAADERQRAATTNHPVAPAYDQHAPAEAAAAGPCPSCDGCGLLADSEDGEPWTAWESLPGKSAAAVTLGIVKPITCPRCDGTGDER